MSTEVHLMPVSSYKEAYELQDRITGCVFTIGGSDGSSIDRLSNGTYQVVLYTADLFRLAKALYDEGFDC